MKKAITGIALFSVIALIFICWEKDILDIRAFAPKQSAKKSATEIKMEISTPTKKNRLTIYTERDIERVLLDSENIETKQPFNKKEIKTKKESKKDPKKDLSYALLEGMKHTVGYHDWPNNDGKLKENIDINKIKFNIPAHYKLKSKSTSTNGHMTTQKLTYTNNSKNIAITVWSSSESTAKAREIIPNRQLWISSSFNLLRGDINNGDREAKEIFRKYIASSGKKELLSRINEFNNELIKMGDFNLIDNRDHLNEMIFSRNNIVCRVNAYDAGKNTQLIKDIAKKIDGAIVDAPFVEEDQ